RHAELRQEHHRRPGHRGPDPPCRAWTGPAPGGSPATGSPGGSLAQLAGDTIAIPAAYRKPGRDLGDAVTLRFGGNATRRLRIVAVFASPRGCPTLLLPASLLAAHTSTGLASHILVTAAAHANRAALANALRGITRAPRSPAGQRHWPPSPHNNRP